MVIKMIEMNNGEIKSGVLIIEIYYPVKNKNYTQYGKRLYNNLPEKLKGYGKIIPVYFGTIKYRNKSTAGILKYNIEYASWTFFIELFQILNKKKNFINAYNVMLSEYIGIRDFESDIFTFIDSLKF
jgi:hypothetical protein